MILIGIIAVGWGGGLCLAEGFAFEKLKREELLWFVGDGGVARPVKTAEEWGVRRGQILEGMRAVMGGLPGEERKVPLEMKVEGEEEVEGVVRQRITFAVEKEDRIGAYLLAPKGLKGKAAGVLCLHQTVAIGEGVAGGAGGSGKELHYALELAKRGMVTLSPELSVLRGFEGGGSLQAGVCERDDEGGLESHEGGGSATIARYGGRAADRGDRAFAGRDNVLFRVGVRYADQGGSVELRV